MRLLFCLILGLAALPQLGGAAEIVIMAVEEKDNYDAVNSMKSFAAEQLRPAGHTVTLVEGDRPVKHHFAGLVEALGKADLLVLFSRRRFLPPDQMAAIKTHLNAGKPLVGIRTANHAFIPRATDVVDTAMQVVWPEFTEEVLGGKNTGYETKGMPYRVTVVPGAEDSPLLAGVDVATMLGYQSLYKVLPLEPDAVPVLLGTASGVDTPPQPLAWTREYGQKKARVFYTSLGAPEEMKTTAVRQLLLNGVSWVLAKP